MENQKIERIGMMFHETFRINRNQISTILCKSLEYENAGNSKLTIEDIKKTTSLGNNVIKSFPAYCKGSGLIKFESNLPTSFGRSAYEFNNSLAFLPTQWLIHYHLSAPNGPGPQFWYNLIVKYFFSGSSFTTSDLIETLASDYWELKGKTLSIGSLDSTARIFISSYYEPDGLGQLNIVSKGGDRFFFNSPTMGEPMVLAYALCHYWETVHPGKMSLSERTILESDLGRIFFLSPQDLLSQLNELKALGIIEINRAAEPYQVILKKGAEQILAQIYGN